MTPVREAYDFVAPGGLLGGTSFVAMATALDSLLASRAHRLGASELLPPATVSWSTLTRARYLESFPQHVTALATVRHDLQSLDCVAVSDSSAAQLDEFEVTEVALAPAACLHLYAMHADSRVRVPVLRTLLATCGRYEATAHERRDHYVVGGCGDPGRLWTYRVRELVCLGGLNDVLRFRDDCVDLVTTVLADIDLPSRLVVATDSFQGASAAELTRYQHRLAVKLEVVPAVPVAGAIGSLNFHGKHFGLGFGIHDGDGNTVHSACLGFGIERMALTALAAHGTEPERWPDVLRRRWKTLI